MQFWYVSLNHILCNLVVGLHAKELVLTICMKNRYLGLDWLGFMADSTNEDTRCPYYILKVTLLAIVNHDINNGHDKKKHFR